MDASAAPTRQLVRMRGRSYVALVFCPAVPIVGWLEEIDATLARSPGFFVGKPVVLDLSAVDLSQSGIAHLVTSLEQRNIRVPSLTHTIPFYTPPLYHTNLTNEQSPPFTPRGSIHVYGTLRGRAMAGVNGNSAARIYCQKIEAELLAIDGYYQTAEDISATLRNRPAQAWLDGDIMKISPLN